MLEAVHTDLVFTISLKRSTQNLQLSTSGPADYPIFRGTAEVWSIPEPRSNVAAGQGDKLADNDARKANRAATVGTQSGYLDTVQ
jgi:hypothetical protein